MKFKQKMFFAQDWYEIDAKTRKTKQNLQTYSQIQKYGENVRTKRFENVQFQYKYVLKSWLLCDMWFTPYIM